MDRHEVVLTPEEVQLPGNEALPRLLRRIDHDEVVAAVGVAARTLVRPGHILESQLVKAERAAEQRDLFGSRVADVEPEPILVAPEQLAEPVDIDLRR